MRTVIFCNVRAAQTYATNDDGQGWVCAACGAPVKVVEPAAGFSVRVLAGAR